MSIPVIDSGSSPLSVAPERPTAQTQAATPAEILAFIEGDLSSHVERYADHAAELNWLMANHGPSMTAEQMEAAIENYVDRQGDEWKTEFEQSQQQVIDDGRALLEMLGHPDTQNLSAAEREAILSAVEDNPEAQTAVLLALGESGEVNAETLDAAMDFFSGVDLAGSAPDFANALGQSYLDRTRGQIELIDPNRPHTIDTARAAVDDLRNSNYAALLDLPQAEFDALVDAIEGTFPDEGLTATQMEARLEAVADAADALDNAAGGASVTQGLRVLALASGAVSLWSSGSDFFDNPNPETAIRSLSGLVGLGRDTTDLLVDAGVLARDGRVASTLGSPALGKVLGAVGLVMGGVDLYRDVRDGDYAQAGLTTAGLAGSALALFGTTSWAGPVGIAIGVAAVAGSIGLNQYRNVQASNQHMNETSARFLEHAGFSPEAAGALVDQSGQGLSPVPFLFAYGESMGMDREQTITWLNSLNRSELDSIRDRAHYSLDAVNGDLSELEGDSDAETLDFLAGFEQMRLDGDGSVHHQGNHFYIGNETTTAIAGTWEEFTAVLSAKGLVPPSAPVASDSGMDLQRATEVLLDNYDDVRHGSRITAEDLGRVRDDESADLELRQAAEFVLNSRAARNFLDVGRGRGSVDGEISQGDLEEALELIESGEHLDALADTASGRGGRDGNISDEDLYNVRFDPALTTAQQRAVEAEMEARGLIKPEVGA